jgi:hypothetical protein
MHHEPMRRRDRVPIAALALAIATPIAGGAEAGGFTENVGQLPAEVLYHARAPGASFYLTAEGPVIGWLGPRGNGAAAADAPLRSRDLRPVGPSARYALAVRFAGDAMSTVVEGLDPLPGRKTFVMEGREGPRASTAREFRGVVVRGVWPGIDIAYRLAPEGALLYEILAGPGSDASQVAFEYEGGDASRESDSVWIVKTPLGTVRDTRPAEPGGVGRVTLERKLAGTAAPADDGVHWSTLLGGSVDEEIHAVAIDSADRPVVAGIVRSDDFPVTPGVLDPSWSGSFDVFVARFSATGDTLEWSTYLGADGDDRGWAIALDAQDRPIVAGVTTSGAFPTTAGAYDTSHNGGFDAFVAQLSADGTSLVWSTLFGGGDWEFDVSGIALDAADRPLIAGSTESGDLPATAGAWDETLGGAQDAFVAQLSADGTSLVWSTFLGGSDRDVAEDVAVTPGGRPVVTGRTHSADFPTSAGAFQPAPAGPGSTQDAFVAWLSADGSGLDASTYVGGAGNDEAYAVTVLHGEAAIVAGQTLSTDFPTTAGSLYPSFLGAGDAFVTRVVRDATDLAWSTYLGGTAGDRALDAASDLAGRASVAGWTCAGNFPTAGTPYDADYNGPCDAYVARLSADGSALQYASFLGGYADDAAHALALDCHHRFLVGGRTTSPDFPATPGAYGTEHASPEIWEDAFLTWLEPPRFCTSIAADGSLTITDLPPEGCARGPAAEPIDLIEGRLEDLGPADIGEVWPIACDADEAGFESGTVPPQGAAYFQLAREGGGTYADGGGSTLVGSRIPLAGDCP